MKLREIPNWPLTAGACLSNDSPEAGDTDLISRASLSRDGHFVMHLSRQGKAFTTSVPLPTDCAHLTQELLSELKVRICELKGKTVKQAGELSLPEITIRA